MSIFESMIENAKGGHQETHSLENAERQLSSEGKIEGFEAEQLSGDSEKTSDYQDRIERLKQRSEERAQSAKDHQIRKNEISFGSRAAENAADKLETRKNLEQQIKKQEEKLQLHEKELKQAGNSDYWTQKRTQEIKDDIRNIKNLEKKIKDL